MTVMVDTQLSNLPFQLGGDAMVAVDETLLQDAARTAAMVYGTVVSKNAAGKWVPLTDVSAESLIPATLTCGANGGNLAAWQAVADGSMSIEINGTLTDFTAIAFTSIVGLEDIAEVFNASFGGQLVAEYDITTDVVSFHTPIGGVGQTLTVLTKTDPASGTDITGTGFLNGLTAVGTAVAGSVTGVEGVPAGILTRALTAAQIVAGDVTEVPIINFGRGLILDQDQITLENSLALTDIVYANAKNKSIRDCMNEIGITFKDTLSVDEYANV